MEAKQSEKERRSSWFSIGFGADPQACFLHQFSSGMQ